MIAADIRAKLADDQHHVKEGEVHEAFMNREGPYLEDDREEHRTDPPTEWFLSYTDRGRLLKVIFVFQDGNIFLKSAYDANEKTIHIYTERSKQQEN